MPKITKTTSRSKPQGLSPEVQAWVLEQTSIAVRSNETTAILHQFDFRYITLEGRWWKPDTKFSVYAAQGKWLLAANGTTDALASGEGATALQQALALRTSSK